MVPGLIQPGSIMVRGAGRAGQHRGAARGRGWGGCEGAGRGL